MAATWMTWEGRGEFVCMQRRYSLWVRKEECAGDGEHEVVSQSELDMSSLAWAVSYLYPFWVAHLSCGCGSSFS